MTSYRRVINVVCLCFILNLTFLTAYAYKPAYSSQPPPGDGQGPDFAAAAQELGITVEELQAALNPPPPDFAKAATTLGISEETLRNALDTTMTTNPSSSYTSTSFGESMNTITDTDFIFLTGDNINDAFGGAVSSAGDVNGDGFDDVMIGARVESQDGDTSISYVSIYAGNATGEISEPLTVLKGEDVGTEFGRSLGLAGDVNGDGYDDVLVGAHAYNNHQGKAYLYLGSASGVSIDSIWITSGEKERDEYGRFVYTAGDVNADGYDDVLVGASGFSDAYELQGKLYVYLGSSAGLSQTPDYTVVGDGENYEFARSATTAGDINNDGFGDIVVGVPGLTKGGETSTTIGMAYIFYGTADGLNISAPTIVSGDSIGDRFGESASDAGDVNGDGFDDIIVGALTTSKAFVFYGSANGLGESPTILTGNQGADFGRAVASAGDVNGDGFDDIIVGASRDNQPYGAFYIYAGSTTGIISEPLFVGLGNETGGGLGFYVAYAGDLNGDGLGDVIAGAPKGGNNQQGQAYIFLGR